MNQPQDWQKIYDHLAPRPSEYWLEEPSLKQKLFLMTKQREVLFGGAAGGGKGLRYNEKVWSPFGSKAIGELKVGDRVAHPNGGFSNVIAVHHRGIQPFYRVTFSDGAFLDTDADHLWTYRLSGKRIKRDTEWLVCTTPQLKDFTDSASAQKDDGCRPNWPLIPLTEPLKFTVASRNADARWPLDPYLLGALIGDGCLSKPSPSFASEDPEIVEHVSKALSPHGVRLVHRGGVDYGISGDGKQGGTTSKFRTVLQDLGVAKKAADGKCIPDKYLVRDVDSRRALMQGLMDTDGYVDSRGHASFVSISQTLAEQVQWLARSLGFKATLTSKEAHYTDAEGNRIRCNDAFTVTFTGRNAAELFRLERKRSRCSEPQQTNVRRVVSVEPLEPEESVCITVDAPDGLFVAGDGFVVTHNSSALIMSALQYVDIPGYSAIMFRRTFSDLALPGALMDRFKEWMSEYPEVSWNNNSYTATFPSGARVTFGYLNNINDKLRYKGSEFQFCVRGDTAITMADGTSKPISEIEPDVDYVQTLEGPRKVTHKYHVGMKPSVYLFTPNGCIVTSDNHALLTANGRWQDPTSLAANQRQLALSSAAASEKTRPGSQGPGIDSHWGLTPIPEPARLEQALKRLQEIYASEASGRNDYESFVNELLEDPLLPVATFHAALHGPDPQTGAYAFSGFAQQDDGSHELSHPSQLSSLDDYWLYHDRNDGLLRGLPVAAQAHTPSPAGAATQYLPSSHLDGLVHTRPHNQTRSGKLYHPYTNQEMELTDGVHRAYAGMIPAGEQDLWDIRVEGSSHYISTTSSTLHKNCGFDEVTEIRQDDYLYLFSRLRQPATGPLSQIPLRMRATTNPAPNWVRQRFIVEGKDKGRLFIPSSLEDNPGINVESYRETLQELDPVERKRLEFGDWWASSLGSMFPRENFTILEDNELPEFDKDTRWVRFWDLAGTKPSHSNPDPDYSVGTLMAFHEGVAYVMDVVRFREEGDEVERRIRQTAIEDGPEVPIRMEQEPGSAGKNLLDQYARYVLPGLDFTGVRATGAKDVRAKPMSSAAANGNVRLKMAPWNTDWIDEHSAFPEGRVHDDQVDSAVHAFNYTAGLDGGFRRKLEIIL